jgi:C-terminal processing protease CtpA/Prc
MGDVLVAIDGADVSQMRTEEVAARLMGPQGTLVPVCIRRGQDTIDVKMIRDNLRPVERSADMRGLAATGCSLLILALAAKLLLLKRNPKGDT